MNYYKQKLEIAEIRLQIAQKEYELSQIISNLPNFNVEIDDLSAAVCMPELLRIDYPNKLIDSLVSIRNDVEVLKLKIFNLETK